MVPPSSPPSDFFTSVSLDVILKSGKFLEDAASTFPSSANLLDYMLKIYNKRLWHQLTIEILGLVRNASSSSSIPHSFLVELYENVVRDNLEFRMNAIIHADIVYSIMTFFPSAKDCLRFVEEIRPRLAHNDSANALLTIAIAELELISNHPAKTEQILRKLKTDYIDKRAQSSVPVVDGRFYGLLCTFYQIRSDHFNYYKSALALLKTVSRGFAGSVDPLKIGFNAVLAAIVSPEVTDVGEVCRNRLILDGLGQSKSRWIMEFARIISNGDLRKLESTRDNWTLQPDLKRAENVIREKTALSALCEVITSKGSVHEGIKLVRFEEIEKALETDQVESLLMKAMSCGLIEGKIDEPLRIFKIKQVKPRMIEAKQIELLAKKIAARWECVKKMNEQLKETASDLIN